MRFLTVLLCLVFISEASARQIQTDIKAAYINQFVKYIAWPNEDTPRDINIAYLGDDNTYWQSLQELKSVTSSNTTFTLTRLNSISAIQSPHMLIIDENYSQRIAQISRKIAGQPTLLITDSVQQQSNFGINFYLTSDNTISFQLNRYNLIYQGLRMDPDIVLLGGSEIDIASLVYDMEQTLEDTASQLAIQTESLNQLTSDVLAQQQLLEEKTSELQQAAAKLSTTQRNYEQLNQRFNDVSQKEKASQEALNAATQELSVISSQLIQKQGEIEQRQDLLDRMTQSMDSLNSRISENQAKIERQEALMEEQDIALEDYQQRIETQSITIEKQSLVMYALLGGGIVLIIIVAINIRIAKSRERANQKLADKNQQLKSVNERLVETQNQLIEAEKMASLGNLVAGIAHELNTPLGVCITAVSGLQESSKHLLDNMENNALKRSELEQGLHAFDESADLTLRNLTRAAELVRVFKQLSVDQSVEEVREFAIGPYVKDVVTNLKTECNRHHLNIELQIDYDGKVTSYAGILSQVLIALIDNTIVHGKNDNDEGLIQIRVDKQEQELCIYYQDNGPGIPDDARKQIFEPFFTTHRSGGSIGLGLHICYNLISHKMGGSIQCLASDSGASFLIKVPLVISSSNQQNSPAPR
ncbi:YfiR/HmsC family protein [Alteromonas facilis]|uniref:YfiR/HmsC family protein n=1 Tax=Alteromonas facilis TaxID=2048004 RepID=UPI000C2832A5|nr:YfiR/HmsC family protein [Alteromonas facilis]